MNHNAGLFHQGGPQGGMFGGAGHIPTSVRVAMQNAANGNVGPHSGAAQPTTTLPNPASDSFTTNAFTTLQAGMQRQVTALSSTASR